MFIVCRGGHLGIYWDGNATIFLEKECAVFPSRKECLHYLINQCKIKKEDAVSAITSMQKTSNWISF